MAEIYLLNISKRKDDYEFSELKKRICGECIRRVEKFRFIDDARRYLYGLILVQYIIEKNFGIDFKEYIFCNNENGKPYISEHPEWQFNISHSGNWVICGFGSLPIGVDIEQTIPCNRVISKQIFSNTEYHYITSLEEEEQTDLFFRLWTLKESYAKYTGMGLRIPFNQLEFLGDSIPVKLRTIENESPFLYVWDIGSGYKMAVCTEEEKPEHIYLAMEELFSEIGIQRIEKTEEKVYV